MSWRRGLWAGLVAGALALSAMAADAPLDRDLGQGLVYRRVRELPADLPSAAGLEKAAACVLDVRYVAADGPAATALAAWLKFRASPRAPVFVLANRESSAELRRALRGIQGGGAAVIGAPAPGFEPDVEVRVTPEDERRAYDAMERGETLERLLTDHPDKVREDEASLLREPPASASHEGQGAPVDAALQRAVHLHRALQALRKS